MSHVANNRVLVRRGEASVAEGAPSVADMISLKFRLRQAAPRVCARLALEQAFEDAPAVDQDAVDVEAVACQAVELHAKLAVAVDLPGLAWPTDMLKADTFAATLEVLDAERRQDG